MNFRIIFLFLNIFFFSTAFAEPYTGIGSVAINLFEPLSIATNFVGSGSILVGGACLFASFIKYMQYRVNPLASPIGNVIFLFIGGVVLICLPLAYQLTESGIKFGS